MRSTGLKTLVVQVTIIVAGFAAITALSGYLEKNRPPLPVEYEDQDLTMNGSRLRGFALGFEGLMADWYWMRSLQYIGDKLVHSSSEVINIDDLRDLNPRLLYPYLDNATDLDPHFLAAYSYGAVVLPAIDPEKAIAIAKKGIANNPAEWRLYQHLGVIYWRLKRYEDAAEIFDQGARIEGAAPFMRLMAASMKTEGGSRVTARQIYLQMFNDSTDDMVRITATRRLKELDSLDEREVIDRVLAEFRERTGRCANNFSEIIPLLMTEKLPEGREFRVDNANRLVDPTDAPYLLNRERCVSELDRAKTAIATQ